MTNERQKEKKRKAITSIHRITNSENHRFPGIVVHTIYPLHCILLNHIPISLNWSFCRNTVWYTFRHYAWVGHPFSFPYIFFLHYCTFVIAFLLLYSSTFWVWLNLTFVLLVFGSSHSSRFRSASNDQCSLSFFDFIIWLDLSLDNDIHTYIVLPLIRRAWGGLSTKDDSDINAINNWSNIYLYTPERGLAAIGKLTANSTSVLNYSDEEGHSVTPLGRIRVSSACIIYKSCNSPLQSNLDKFVWGWCSNSCSPG